MIESSAIFSDDRVYRYVLTRSWDTGKPKCMFIGLNPSTADEIDNDPTVRRCINFARDLDYGTLVMMNIFGLRSTDPKVLYHSIDPVGPDNDYWLRTKKDEVNMVIAAWGNHGRLNQRSVHVITMIHEFHVLGITKLLEPKHPLYLRQDLYPIPYKQALKNPHFIPIRQAVPVTSLDHKFAPSRLF